MAWKNREELKVNVLRFSGDLTPTNTKCSCCGKEKPSEDTIDLGDKIHHICSDCTSLLVQFLVTKENSDMFLKSINDGLEYEKATPEFLSMAGRTSGCMDKIDREIQRDERKRLNELNKATNNYMLFDMGYDSNDEKYAMLFEETKDVGIKIVKSINISSNKLDEIADQLINEVSKYENCKLIIPNPASRIGILDYFYAKDFTDIIEINKEDIREAITNSIGIVQNKEKLYKIFMCDNQTPEYIELIKELCVELSNLEIEVTQRGNNIRFKRKLNDIDCSKINTVFWTLSKLGIRL